VKKGVSLHLDLLRLIASLAVVVGHARSLILPCLPNRYFDNGPEAVAAFFVLSGLVISYVTLDRGERDWRSYAIARISRIGSVVIIALPLLFLVDQIGFVIAPDIYLAQPWFDPGFHFLTWLRALTFTNEVWFSHSVLGSNEPYWSLGFEVPYYLLFGVFTFMTGGRRLVAILLWSLCFGIKIIAYLPLWLMGVGLYRILRSISKPNRAMGVLASLTGLIGLLLLRSFKNTLLLTVPMRIFAPTGILDFTLSVYYYSLFGALFALHIFGTSLLFGEAGAKSAITGRGERLIRWLAGGSFTIYVVHLPLLLLAKGLLPEVSSRPAEGALVLLAVIAASLLLAEAGERRKDRVRAVLQRLLRWSQQS